MGWKSWLPKRLVCPHCGYDGTTAPSESTRKYDVDAAPFYWLEDATIVWPVLGVAGQAVEGGLLQMGSDSDTPGDSFGTRLFCSRCESEFPVPAGADAEFLFDDAVDWSEHSPTLSCRKCHRPMRACATQRRCYHCDECGAVVGH